MIKDNNNYLYLIVPNEYRCVYYHILDTLGTLGEDLLSSCTATCKGRAINGIACYNMFLAAAACYYLGQVKRARVLINYIKAQLEIECDKTIVFEDSTKDEWVFAKVPIEYQYLFEALLNKMSTWGQELLDDCTASCRGNNKNILNSWNLFQSVIIAFENGDTGKANDIATYIANVINVDVPIPPGPGPEPEPEPEPTPDPDFNIPVLKSFAVYTNYEPEGPTIDINDATIEIENKESIVENSMKLINYSTGVVIADNLPVTEDITAQISGIQTNYSSDVKFVAEVTGKDDRIYRSNIAVVTTPAPPAPGYNMPVLKNMSLIISSTYVNPTIDILVLKLSFENEENIVANSLVLKDITNNIIVKTNLNVKNSINLAVRNYPVSYNSTVKFVVEATTTQGDIIRSNEFTFNVPGPFEVPVINITQIDYEVVNNKVHITGVRGTIEHPESFNQYGVDIDVSPYGEYDNSYYAAGRNLIPTATFNYNTDIWFDLRTDVDNSNMIDPNNDGTPNTNEFRVLINGIGKDGHIYMTNRAIYVPYN